MGKENSRTFHKEASAQSAGLYIHVPFCLRKCRYCAFASTEDLSLQHAYTEAVCREMTMTAEAFPAFDTLYIGGGTPTAIDCDRLVRILETAFSVFSFTGAPEVTVEANPGTVSAEGLGRLFRAGVNRLNLGVQSFADEHLLFLGRIHTAADAAKSVGLARHAGFASVGLDLMYGLPGQGEAAWIEDLQKALAFSPEHLSCYMLTYEEKTPLCRDLEAGRVAAPRENTVASLFAATAKRLRAEGYLHYEISNFARSPALRSCHNRKYWTGAPYLGLGPGAHSFLNTPPTRWWNTAEPSRYLKMIQEGRRPVDETERLTPAQSMTETLFLALRTEEGIDPAAFERRFSVSFDRLFGDLAAALAEEGMLANRDGRWAPTLRGMQFAEGVARRFIERI